MLSPRVPHHVPIAGPRMERETPGQRPRPNYGHPQARLGRASAAAIAPSKLRSASVSSGRSTCRRSTASWWRNTTISRSFERPDRTASPASDARNRYKIRYTRTQHRPASRQVNDHDRVSGTHRVVVFFGYPRALFGGLKRGGAEEVAPVHRQNAHIRRGCDRRSRQSAHQQRHLAEEVARPDLLHLFAVAFGDSDTLVDDQELPAGHALSGAP